MIPCGTDALPFLSCTRFLYDHGFMTSKPGFLAPSNPLRRPGYRYMMSFSAVVAMGGGFHFIASYWLLWEKTTRPESIAWLSIAFWVPSLIVMPIGGVMIDRLNRRLILAGICGYLLTMNLILVLLLLTGWFRFSHLYVYGAFCSFGAGLFWTAILAYIKDVLKPEELLHANSLNTALFSGGYLMGAGSAGLFYQYIGPIGCFVVDSAGLGLGVVGWLTLGRWFPDRARLPSASGDRGILADFVEGIRYVRANMTLFLFALFAIVPRISSQIANVLLVGFSGHVLAAGSVGFGVLDMAYGLGVMTCGLVFPVLLHRVGMHWGVPTLALLLATVAVFSVSFASGLATAALALAAFGACCNVVGILANTGLQREASSEVIGRLTSTVQLCQYAMIPVIVWSLGKYASLPRGHLWHAEPLRDAFVATAGVFLFLALLSLFVTRPFLKRRSTAWSPADRDSPE